MSETLEPEIPDTTKSEQSSTYDMPAFTWPSSEARKSTIALPMPVWSRIQPSSTKIGTEIRMRCDMPSSMRPIMTKVETRVAKAR